MRGSIIKRKKSWAVVLFLGRDANGRKRQKWHSGYETKQEAEAALPALLTQVQAGAIAAPSRLFVRDYLNQWLDSGVALLPSPKTRDAYRNAIENHLNPGLGHLQLTKLGKLNIEAFLAQKLQTKLSHTSVRSYFNVLKIALNNACRDGMLPRNPAALVRLPSKPQREHTVWDIEETRRFLGEAKLSSSLFPLYLLAASTGMRQAELLGLRWRDVNLLLNTVTVAQIFYRLSKRESAKLGKTYHFKPPKTKQSRRTLHVDAGVLAVLREFKTKQDEQRRVLGRDYEDNELVFAQPNGKPLHSHNVSQRDFRGVIKRAKLRPIRFHDLRHGYGSQLARMGTPLKVIQEQLAHSSPTMTLAVYSHALPGMGREATEKLTRAILGGTGDGA